jgi:hypothetical protein
LREDSLHTLSTPPTDVVLNNKKERPANHSGRLLTRTVGEALSPTETDLQVRLRSRRGSRPPGRRTCHRHRRLRHCNRAARFQRTGTRRGSLFHCPCSSRRQMGKRKYTSDSKRDGDETAKKSKTAEPPPRSRRFWRVAAHE